MQDLSLKITASDGHQAVNAETSSKAEALRECCLRQWR